MGMTRSLAGRLLAAGGAFGLGLAGTGLPAAATQVKMCGGGSVPLPIGPGRDQPAGKCAFACHLNGERKRLLDDDGEDGATPPG